MRKNKFTTETEEEINEIVIKNFLKSKDISYNKLGDHIEKVVGADEDDGPAGDNSPVKNGAGSAGDASPVKTT